MLFCPLLVWSFESLPSLVSVFSLTSLFLSFLINLLIYIQSEYVLAGPKFNWDQIDATKY